MNNKKTICIITGTRAEYGLLRPLLAELYADSFFDVRIAVTGSHLSEDFGYTYKEIEADGYAIDAKIPLGLDADTPANMARATGQAVLGFVDYFEARRPDMAVLLGDRYELLGAGAAAAMLLITIAHINGGDTSEGAMDEFIRHALTKMGYLHFPTNAQSARRIVQLGEDPSRVFNVGSLGVDNALSRPLISREALGAELGFDLSSEYALCTLHPTTLEGVDTNEAEAMLAAISRFDDMKFLFTKANADAGGRAINALLDDFCRDRANCAVYSSLGNLRYLSAMKHAALVIGNSSSGLYETPAFGTPCVNIGDRQKGRMRAGNVIDCAPDEASIEAAIKKARSPEFANRAKNVTNPFGDGHAAAKIARVIKQTLVKDGIDLKKEFYCLDER